MDWQSARWIWLDENVCKESRQVIFQRDFRLDALPSRAVLFLTADSSYRLRINGQWCADGPVRPFTESCFFDTIDCSSLLRCGLNRLEADVYFSGTPEADRDCRGGFLALLKLIYADETVEYISSDNSWRAADVPQRLGRTIRYSALPETVEVFDNSIAEQIVFSSAVIVSDPGAGCRKQLIAGETPRLTRCEALIRRVTNVSLVEKDLRCLYFQGAEKGSVALCGVEFSSPASEGNIFLYQSSGRLNGKDVSGTCAPVSAGENFIVLREQAAANGTFGAAFSAGPGIVPLRMFRVAVAPEKLENMRESFCRISSMQDFLAMFPESVEVAEGDLSSDGGRLSFLNRKAVPAPRETVDDLQALIYPDDRCTVIHPAEGFDVELCCDLGKIEIGCWNFVLHAPAGTVVDISAVGAILPDGTPVQPENTEIRNLRYICREGWNRFTSSVRRGGRYLFVTLRGMTAPVLLQSLRLVESTYPVVECGGFHSSSRELDQIYEASSHTLKLCMADTFIDGPLGRLCFDAEDFRSEALFALSCFGADDLLRHSLKRAFDSVCGNRQKQLSGKDFFPVFALADMCRELADDALLRELYPAALCLLERAVKQLDPLRGLLANYGDDGAQGNFVLRDNLLLKGALDAALSLAEKAGILPQENAWLSSAAENLSEAAKKLWDDRHLAFADELTPSGEPVAGFSVENSMLALLFDVIPENRRASLCAAVISPGGELKPIDDPAAGVFLLETLELHGMPGELIEKIRSGVFEKYCSDGKAVGFPLRGASALALYAFPRILLGLRTCDGGRSFTVSPFVQELTYASGTRWTANGPVSVNWRKEAERFLFIDVSVPAGVTVQYQENISLKEFDIQFNVFQSGKV